MTWRPATEYVQTTDYDPVRSVRVKKMIWNDQDQAFQTHYFIRVTCENRDRARETEAWLQDQFGDAEYQGTWWPDPSRSGWIWLADNIATFWQLKYGGQS